VFFAADDGDHGQEPWLTDGTARGTRLLRDIVAGPAGSEPSSPVVLDHRIAFTAGGGLWVCDGTPSGTFDLRDSPGRPSFFRSLFAAFGRLYFSATDGTNGVEPWVSDGTPLGTQVALDVEPGPGSGMPFDAVFTVAQDRTVLFAATDGVSSAELWRSDGTAAGTFLAADLAPGPTSAGPAQFHRAGSSVFFLACDAATGAELWSVPVAATRASVAEAFGSPCASGAVPTVGFLGLPSVGNAGFALTVADTAPGSLVLLAASTERGDLPLGGCVVYPELPVVLSDTVANGAGAAAIALPVPNTPSLVGATVFGQWFVLVPAGPVLGSFDASRGLYVIVGS
jgi:ELWxxDGT repeat protein